MLYDSGGRTGGTPSLQRKNIIFDEHGAVVIVDGKTISWISRQITVHIEGIDAHESLCTALSLQIVGA